MGYELTRFVDEIDEELLCTICKMVLKNPVQTPCYHTFCSECIKGRLSIDEDKICPVDRKPVTIGDLELQSKTFRCRLNKLDIKCDFRKRI